jgi:chromosome partitioning protein
LLTIAVVNLKGGCGKTTLSVHLAARFVGQGFRAMLVDLDRQEAATAWIGRRAPSLRRIETERQRARDLEVPRDAAFVVLDVPAGLKEEALERTVRAADVVLVPVLASPIDMAITTACLAELRGLKSVRDGRKPVGLVANRLRARTKAATAWEAWAAGTGLPVAGRLIERNVYADLAAEGRTIFDQPASKVKPALAEWAPLLTFVDTVAADLVMKRSGA